MADESNNNKFKQITLIRIIITTKNYVSMIKYIREETIYINQHFIQ